jgi:hypothetical protein
MNTGERSASRIHRTEDHPWREYANRYVRDIATEEEVRMLEHFENLEEARAALLELQSDVEAQMKERLVLEGKPVPEEGKADKLLPHIYSIQDRIVEDLERRLEEAHRQAREEED